MKKISTKKKILIAVCILIIIAGIVIFATLGFNKSIDYSAGTRIEIYIPKGYEKEDIINIANECFANKEVEFVEVEKLNQVAGIKIKEYSNDELENLKTKLIEKYEIDKEDLKIYEITIPETSIKNAITPYIAPTLIATALSLAYIIIRNIKSSKVLNILIKFIFTLILVISLYFSLILIFRITFTDFIIPIALAIYIITLLILINNIKK